MARIILALCLLISSVVSAQPGWTNINSRYKWIGGGFDSSLILPRYNGVPSGLRSAWNTDGQLAVDTANNHLYVYSGGAWIRLANYSDVSSYTFTNGLVKNSSGVVGLDSAGVNPLDRDVLIIPNETNIRSFQIGQDGDGGNMFQQIKMYASNFTIEGNSASTGHFDFDDSNGSWGGIDMNFSASGAGHNILASDSIRLSAGGISKVSLVLKNDSLIIINLPPSTVPTDKMMVWDSTSGKVATRLIPSGGGGSGTVTSVATNNGTGITGGTITGSGTLAIDTANTIATRLQLQHRIDSLAALNYNLLVENLGATGTEMQRVNNDTLYIRKIVAGDFILVDTLATGEVQVTIDTASSAFQAYIASYGGGGSGDGNLARAGVYGDGVHNQWLDTTINRIAYSEGNFIYRVAITDSIDNTTYDADAQAYIDAVNATDVTLTVTEKGFINDYFLGLKADGLWSLIYDQGLPIWGTAASSAVMLKLTHTTTWVNTPTFGSTGATGNGTTQYGNLNFTPTNAFSSQDNSHIAVYIQNAVTDVNQTDIGVVATSPSRFLRINSRASSATQTYLNDATVGASTVASSAGFTIYTRTSSTNVAAYKNGTFVNNNTSTSTGLGTINIYILASNQDGSPGVWSTRTMSLWSVGATLNATQSGNLSTRVNQLMTDLGINVY